MSVEHKICTKCGEMKPLEDFYRVRTGAEKRHGRCIDCTKNYMREHKRLLLERAGVLAERVERRAVASFLTANGYGDIASLIESGEHRRSA